MSIPPRDTAKATDPMKAETRMEPRIGQLIEGRARATGTTGTPASGTPRRKRGQLTCPLVRHTRSCCRRDCGTTSLIAAQRLAGCGVSIAAVSTSSSSTARRKGQIAGFEDGPAMSAEVTEGPAMSAGCGCGSTSSLPVTGDAAATPRRSGATAGTSAADAGVAIDAIEAVGRSESDGEPIPTSSAAPGRMAATPAPGRSVADSRRRSRSLDPWSAASPSWPLEADEPRFDLWGRRGRENGLEAAPGSSATWTPSSGRGSDGRESSTFRALPSRRRRC